MIACRHPLSRLMFRLVVAVALAAITPGRPALAAAAEIPSPESFLGHPVGEDRFLAPYPRVLAYLRALDEASDRVSTRVLGRSTLGQEMMLVVITSEENQRELLLYSGVGSYSNVLFYGPGYRLACHYATSW